MSTRARSPSWSRRRTLKLSTTFLLLLVTTTTKVCRSCSDGESNALLRHIQPLIGPEFSIGRLGWDVTQDCCRWEGVTCSGAGRRQAAGRRVVSLSLAGLGIAGAIDAAVLAPFTALEKLDLSGNQITTFSAANRSDIVVGAVLNNLTALTELHLAGNEITTTGWISNLTSLQVIDMSSNKLHELNGICGLHQLKYLSLGFNMIQGAINPCLGKLQHLVYLDMGSNFLIGEIGPNLLSNLTQVEEIHLGDNNLTGTFDFSSLANNSELHSIVLSNNYKLEIETELVRWTPLFQLEYLNLSNSIVNKRSNGIIPTFLSAQMRLSGIDLSICSLQGRIPSWMLLYNVSLGFLLLHGNSMDFLDTGNLGANVTSSMEVLDLSDNRISMPMPYNLGSLFPYLKYLDMSSNLLYGGVPSLAEAASSLQVLDLSFNMLNGDISTELTGNASILTSLLLSHNDLTGPMPPFHWSLGGLIHLSVENNQLSGGLPPLLMNCTNLENLNVRNNRLSGVIPVGLLSFEKLGALLLGGNQFHGVIPWDICLNNYLHFIDLSNNRFSGEIPGCLYSIFWSELPMYYEDDPFIGNIIQRRQTSVEFTTKGESLTYMGMPLELMTGIDLSMNRLSGTIPSPVGFLRQLKSLNLSHNKLVGSIPDTFMYLREMESMDLSHNHLNGSVPVELADLSFLSFFSIAYNNLSGEIPFESQFCTLNGTAFEGNENLCGEIVDKICPMNWNRSHDSDDEMHQLLSTDTMDMPLIYWSFVAGSFAIGFWGIIALLIWNTACRSRLCSVMDRCIYKMGWFLVP
uniref:Leucine-rich repeat-containing N-terminal plant-type domain-containing protein n=1 Tax=Oryza punctata TaxID=4537 RepID=A0A0E0KMB4_ORYPU